MFQVKVGHVVAVEFFIGFAGVCLCGISRVDLGGVADAGAEGEEGGG